jgi:hypothetical protein
MYEDSYQGQISEEQIFFGMEMTLGGLSMKIFSDTSTDWQVNARNYEMGVKQFESTAIRHLDKEYFKKLRVLLQNGKDKINNYRRKNPQISLTSMGKEYELMIALEVARNRFALIIKALDRHDVYSQKSYQGIERGKKNVSDGGTGLGEAIQPDAPAAPATPPVQEPHEPHQE